MLPTKTCNKSKSNLKSTCESLPERRAFSHNYFPKFIVMDTAAQTTGDNVMSGKLWDALVVIGLIVVAYLLIRLYKRLCRKP
jgi:hypothetical protein